MLSAKKINKIAVYPAYKLGFNGELRFLCGVSPHTPLKELFGKKFLKDLQKLSKINDLSYVFIHLSPTARARSVKDSMVLYASGLKVLPYVK